MYKNCVKAVRRTVINQLWQSWRDNSSEIRQIEAALAHRGCSPFVLDHFAVIDLPSVRSGISELRQIFSAIGYQAQGCGYLPDKQNDFLWMAEEDSAQCSAQDALPQVVIADFRLDEMPIEIKNIIEKYVALTNVSPLNEIKQLVMQPDTSADISKRICDYLMTGRDWPLPTAHDFLTVHAFNELLAWVLVFGRKPNHFTVSVHLLPGFEDLAAFNRFVERDIGLLLNTDGGVIKGKKESGIAQSSTKGALRKVQLSDGEVELPTDFTEFVWRYPASSSTPTMWHDYFTGFVAQHADYVIESLS
jgi:hypothetical protein